MTTVADYQILNDSPIRLIAGGDQSEFFRFNLPNDFVEGTNRAKPLLVFRCTAHSDSRVQVFVNPDLPDNGTSSGFPQDTDYSFAVDGGRTNLHMEALNGLDFNDGQENTIVIRIAGDSFTSHGDLTIGDVVLHYQRSI